MSPRELRLPTTDGSVETFTVPEPVVHHRPPAPITVRTVYAAAHVAADPLGANAPGAPAAVDWDATLAFRRHLWSWGLGVADAMDTAQRGMGLDWATTAELIRRSAREAKAVGGALVAGVGTDHRAEPPRDLDDVVAAYLEQLEVVEDAGAQPVLMASRHLCALARGPEDYQQVYAKLLGQAAGPVHLHWLGPMFDPALSGYWGSADPDQAAASLLTVIRADPQKVAGVKVSMLDADLEIRLRKAVPAGSPVFTGDDFNYPNLVLGDRNGHSEALLGIFDPIAPIASAALQRLQAGDQAGYRDLLGPTVPLARHLFSAPTFHYKTGIVLLAWLAGHQPGFTMVAGAQSGRSTPHLAETFRGAAALGLFPDPDLATSRMRNLLDVAGVPQ